MGVRRLKNRVRREKPFTAQLPAVSQHLRRGSFYGGAGEGPSFFPDYFTGQVSVSAHRTGPAVRAPPFRRRADPPANQRVKSADVRPGNLLTPEGEIHYV